jgi:lysophospholipase L1-like esterase
MVHARSSSRSLPYELHAGFDGVAKGMRVKINSLGMRDDEPLPEGTPGLVRIAAIGDSFTFAMGCNQGEDFPAQLERELRAQEDARGRAFDVLNFGVSGYGTWEEADVLRERAMPLGPELVILGYCLNDPENYPVQPLHAFFHEPWWWQHSHLARYVVGKIRSAGIKTYGKGSYFDFLHAPEGPCWPRVARALDDVRDRCASARVPVVLVVMPMLNAKSWEEYEAKFGRIHEHVAREAQARGFRVLDPVAALRTQPIPAITVAPDDCHLNALGNAIVARELRPVVLSLLAGAESLEATRAVAPR